MIKDKPIQPTKKDADDLYNEIGILINPYVGSLSSNEIARALIEHAKLLLCLDGGDYFSVLGKLSSMSHDDLQKMIKFVKKISSEDKKKIKEKKKNEKINK